MTQEQENLWRFVFAMTERLRADQWALIGGQMVALYAAQAGQVFPRTTRDIDLLANMEVLSANAQHCASAVCDLGLTVQPDSRGKAYRFAGEVDSLGLVVVDVLAPDHRDNPAWLRTRGGNTIEIDGGTQALQRLVTATVHLPTGESAVLPTTSLLGALVLKATAWAVDSRDRDRHSQDAALLVSLIDDVIELKTGLKGSDRKRLGRLNTVLGNAMAQEWLLLDDASAERGRDNWAVLME